MHSTFLDHSHHPDHPSLARNLVLLILGVAAVVATLEFGAAFLIPCGVGAVIVLMVMARLEGLEPGRRGEVEGHTGMPGGDGGAFPGTGPESRARTVSRPIVMDGGSLEHHGSR